MQKTSESFDHLYCRIHINVISCFISRLEILLFKKTEDLGMTKAVASFFVLFMGSELFIFSVEKENCPQETALAQDMRVGPSSR